MPPADLSQTAAICPGNGKMRSWKILECLSLSMLNPAKSRHWNANDGAESMSICVHFHGTHIMGLYLLALLLGACNDGDIVTGTSTPESAEDQLGGGEACESAPQQGSVFHWQIIEQFNDKKTNARSVETVLAKHGKLNLRLLEIDYKNGGRELMNPLHYGPLYIADLEDFVEVSGVYDSAGFVTIRWSVPSPSRLTGISDYQAAARRGSWVRSASVAADSDLVSRLSPSNGASVM